MVKNITIQAGDVLINAELNDTDTANTVWDALPIQANGNTWGHEIYFQIHVEPSLENSQRDSPSVEPGIPPIGRIQISETHCLSASSDSRLAPSLR